MSSGAETTDYRVSLYFPMAIAGRERGSGREIPTYTQDTGRGRDLTVVFGGLGRLDVKFGLG